jgi:hypothetical protein
LRRAGRFDSEVEVAVPTVEERLLILKVIFDVTFHKFVCKQWFSYAYCCNLGIWPRNFLLINEKKPCRGEKDRPLGIILRKDRNMVPAEKSPNPVPPSHY